MYLRLLLVIGVFNLNLALAVAPYMLGLAGVGLLLAAGLYRFVPARSIGDPDAADPDNPLELGAAAIFAAAFIVISLLSSWAAARFGTAGIYVLAAIVGVSDIDPFVLSLAQNGAGQITVTVGTVAILLAASSNNLLKAGYVVLYSGGTRLIWPVAALAVLAVGGIGIAAVLG